MDASASPASAFQGILSLVFPTDPSFLQERTVRELVRSATVLLVLMPLAWLGGCAAERPAGASRLRIAVPADMGPLNPYLGAPDAMLNLVYDKLFEPSPFVEHPTPALAESVGRSIR